ncbi:MAG: hypothetical protein GYA33_02205, partial [Thermogutta sp.]|nr:hypothetical protein [Thermogutta sp.]
MSFECGATAKAVEIIPINDARNDPEQTVVLDLTGISISGGYGCEPGNHSIGNPASATITLVDDDDDWTIAMSATSDKLVEADENTGTFTITRSGDTDARYPITVDFAMSGIARRGIWWGWEGVFNPFTTPYVRYLPTHWGYDYETEVLLAGVVTTETYGGRQETNPFDISTFTP